MLVLHAQIMSTASERMRIAAVSDIHGNLFALDAVLADIERRGVDLIVNLGDIVSGPLLPRETAERLMALGLLRFPEVTRRKWLHAGPRTNSKTGREIDRAGRRSHST